MHLQDRQKFPYQPQQGLLQINENVLEVKYLYFELAFLKMICIIYFLIYQIRNSMLSKILLNQSSLSFKIQLACSKAKQINSINRLDYMQSRHIGPSEKDTQQMLKFCNVNTIEQLIKQAIPKNILDQTSLTSSDLKPAVSESEFLQNLKQTMKENQTFKCYLGYGFYPTLTPTVILRNLLEQPGWYTAYTPYQAEISQGRLQSLLNYQTVIQDLTKLDISNASLLDQASSGGQAFFMAINVHQGKRTKLFVDQNVFITTQAVLKTQARYLNAQVVVGNYKEFIAKYTPSEYCGIIVQSPDSKGLLHDFTSFFKQLNQKKTGVVKIVGSDLLALAVSKAPGQMGADVCYGSSQRLGVPMGFGGPHAGFFSVRKQYIRRIPGKIIGISKDMHENPAYRMALQTRQQHIRREKATSNICTAQILLANISAMYAIYHGPKGLRKISQKISTLADIATRVFEYYGFTPYISSMSSQNIFDTITIINCNSQKLKQAFLKHKINIRVNSASEISLSFSEVTNLVDINQISQILATFTNKPHKKIQQFNLQPKNWSTTLKRGQDYLKQKIFNSIHSQSQMLRYLKYLCDKDIALDRSMIPLGSCTMKLNSTTQMIPLSWPQLNLHPFVPQTQFKGYQKMINQLRQWLIHITKFDQISFQPNSGSKGQYAALCTISQYYKSINQDHRRICLIPKSAHGTNPASAMLAGMKVIPVEVDDGKVSMKDFRQKVQKYKNQLSTFMITFPSTAGKYEQTIGEMCDLIHSHGGQVYMDGANMNAQVGYTSPGFLGADIGHLNLHKTFAIPHGGGGPGMGPIGAKKHLVPFLPSHPFSQKIDPKNSGTMSVSQFGSASILSISYAYCSLLGKQGLRKSTAYAILNANYLMTKLKPYFKILYMSDLDRCSHQFIMDISPLKAKTGISQEDIAKRLIDYGYHAPTMSFPVTGTLMIEPTQSQDKQQLDRFSEALINIHKECLEYPQIVKNAPYTADYLLKDKWQHKFTRQMAAYPLPWVRKRGKYWPTVARISNPYGDKNLICSCPDINSYLDK